MQITRLRFSGILLALLVAHFYSTGQYFYTDILSGEETQVQNALLVKHKIKKITVQAYDGENTLINDFILYQEINLTQKTLTTYSKTNASESSILQTQYNENYFPKHTFDSTEGASTRTDYTYDQSGRLTHLASFSFQQEQPENSASEKRIYFYSNLNVPDSMWRIKGNRDSMLVTFIMAENNLPGEEQWFREGKKVENWYYYYDEKKRLTDIVRFNSSVQKMLPDYLFGYDESGLLTSRIAVQPVTGAFRIWQFQYNAMLLKKEENVMNRNRQTEGKLVYIYEQ